MKRFLFGSSILVAALLFLGSNSFCGEITVALQQTNCAWTQPEPEAQAVICPHVNWNELGQASRPFMAGRKYTGSPEDKYASFYCCSSDPKKELDPNSYHAILYRPGEFPPYGQIICPDSHPFLLGHQDSTIGTWFYCGHVEGVTMGQIGIVVPYPFDPNNPPDPECVGHVAFSGDPMEELTCPGQYPFMRGMIADGIVINCCEATSVEESCGDGVCSAVDGEDRITCSLDCRATQPPQCTKKQILDGKCGWAQK